MPATVPLDFYTVYVRAKAYPCGDTQNCFTPGVYQIDGYTGAHSGGVVTLSWMRRSNTTNTDWQWYRASFAPGSTLFGPGSTITVSAPGWSTA